MITTKFLQKTPTIAAFSGLFEASGLLASHRSQFFGLHVQNYFIALSQKVCGENIQFRDFHTLRPQKFAFSEMIFFDFANLFRHKSCTSRVDSAGKVTTIGKGSKRDPESGDTGWTNTD